MEAKEKFINLLKSTKRDGIEDLIEHLNRGDFFTAPASTRHHEAYEGGLLEHSLTVYDKFCEITQGRFGADSAIIISLLHDVCKINYYVTDYRNAKNEQGKWEKVPYYTVDDKMPIGHGEKSVIMLMDIIPLSLEEMMAIRWHMGAYSGQQYWNTLGIAYKEYPMAMYLHFADMMATYDKEVK